jgi:hypothetical protein
VLFLDLSYSINNKGNRRYFYAFFNYHIDAFISLFTELCWTRYYGLQQSRIFYRVSHIFSMILLFPLHWNVNWWKYQCYYIILYLLEYKNFMFYLYRYNVSWYQTSLHIQKLILFLLQRGSKTFTFNIVGLFILSLDCFASVILCYNKIYLNNVAYFVEIILRIMHLFAASKCISILLHRHVIFSVRSNKKMQPYM